MVLIDYGREDYGELVRLARAKGKQVVIYSGYTLLPEYDLPKGLEESLLPGVRHVTRAVKYFNPKELYKVLSSTP